MFVDPTARDGFAADLGSADDLGSQRVIVATQKDKSAAWAKWTGFCHSLGIAPMLQALPDEKKIDFLLVFAMRYRRDEFTCRSAPRGSPSALNGF